MEKPLILVNFKKLTGNDALVLMKKLNPCYVVLKELFRLAVAVQPCDGSEISNNTEFLVFLHDIFSPAPLHETLHDRYLKDARITGVLLNHPERRTTGKTLFRNMLHARNQGLQTIVSAVSTDEATVFNDMWYPDYLAIENPELIGKPVSIRENCGDMVATAVNNISNRILFGAGIRSDKDIAFVLNNGASGVLLSSVVLKAEFPSNVMKRLLQLN